jgi:hypothetical protein
MREHRSNLTVAKIPGYHWKWSENRIDLEKAPLVWGFFILGRFAKRPTACIRREASGLPPSLRGIGLLRIRQSPRMRLCQ